MVVTEVTPESNSNLMTVIVIILASCILLMIPLSLGICFYFKRNKVNDQKAALDKINAMDMITSAGGISKEEIKKANDAIPFDVANQCSDHSLADTPFKDDDIEVQDNSKEESFRKTELVNAKTLGSKFLPDIHTNKTKSFVPF